MLPETLSVSPMNPAIVFWEDARAIRGKNLIIQSDSQLTSFFVHIISLNLDLTN